MSLNDAIARLNYAPKPFAPGHVWLAGAGPGDPGCLTLDVLDAMARADCIVYDALVSPEILATAGEAKLHFAGKRGGKPSIAQDDIITTLIEFARAGNRVLRLKGGDPYIFGRGGEEALALAEAGITFRILPGLTSAFAALAVNGIPTTMRGINKAFVLATGHAAGTDDDLDWSALAKTGHPIVVYMGLKNLGIIADALRVGGLAPETPVAVIESATTPQERALVSTLDRVAEESANAGMSAPALVVVGHIVSLRAQLVGRP